MDTLIVMSKKYYIDDIVLITTLYQTHNYNYYSIRFILYYVQLFIPNYYSL